MSHRTWDARHHFIGLEQCMGFRKGEDLVEVPFTTSPGAINMVCDLTLVNQKGTDIPGSFPLRLLSLLPRCQSLLHLSRPRHTLRPTCHRQTTPA